MELTIVLYFAAVIFDITKAAMYLQVLSEELAAQHTKMCGRVPYSLKQFLDFNDNIVKT